jgi:hypothetical protein
VEGLFGWERKMNKRMNVETIIGVVERIWWFCRFVEECGVIYMQS